MKYRTIFTIILAAGGIGLMFFYTWCDTTCSYLQGDLFGIDLKYIGMAYMVVLVVLSLCRLSDAIRILLATGIGVEIFLVLFQWREDVFCPFCLAFGLIVVLLYLLHYEWPRRKTQWYQQLLYGAGEVKIPLPRHSLHLPLIIFVVLGYLFISLTFSGSATPAYGAEIKAVASYLSVYTL